MTRLLSYNFQTFCQQIVFLLWSHYLPEWHGRPPAAACLEPPPGNVPLIRGTQPNTSDDGNDDDGNDDDGNDDDGNDD